MASKKISYNDLKNNSSNQLAQAFSSGKSVVSYNTGFEKVKVDTIKEDPKGDFTEIFAFNEDAANTIAESIKSKGYDKTQCIHLAKILEEPDTINEPIRLDGAHRVAAAKIAGIEEIPAYIHTFETRTEALIYTYELQLNRRNLEPGQKLAAFEKLDALKNPGRKKDVSESTGKSITEISKVMGISERQGERFRNIINNGTEEIKEAVKSGEISVSKGDQLTNELKKKKERKEKDDDFTNDNDFENDFSSGEPKGLPNFDHSDHIERPSTKLSAEEDSERTQERKKAYELGKEEAWKEASDIIYKIFCYVVVLVKKGKSAEEIYNDELLSDFSPSVIKRFILSNENEKIIDDMNNVI